MDINKELLLIRSVILEEIHNTRNIDTNPEKIEARTKYLSSLLKKTSANYLHNFTNDEKLDIVTLITNMIDLLSDELAYIDNVSDLVSNEINTLELLLSDYNNLLKKFVS